MAAVRDFRALAAAFAAKAKEYGFSIEARGEIVTVQKFFTAGDSAAYAAAESDAYSLLDMVPAGIGSVWGTDSGSVGGHVGHTRGYMRLNKSGVKKLFLRHLTALVGESELRRAW